MNNEIENVDTFDVVELDEYTLSVVVGGLASKIEGNYKCNSSCNTVAGCGGGTTRPSLE